MRVDAHPRDAARHAALHRRRRGQGARRARRRGRRAPRRRRRAPDHGRRADLCLDRRYGGRGVEYRRGRADKRALAEDLMRRLRSASRRAALLHYGQGKWYPGEPLPRWAFALYWRRTASRSGRTRDLIAREATEPRRRSRTPQRSCRGAGASSSACPPTVRARPTRIRRLLRADRAEAAGQRRRRTTTSCEDPAERARHRRASSSAASTRRELRAADPGVALARPRPPLGDASAGSSAASKLFLCRAIRPPASACRWRSLPQLRRDRLSARASPRDPLASAPPLPERGVAACEQPRAAIAVQPRSGAAAQRAERDRAARSAPRSRSSRATASCACSCRRVDDALEDYRGARRRGRGDGRARPGSRFISRAMRRRPIRASTSSRSRPTPA